MPFDRIEEFKRSNRSPAFKCINDRAAFANKLKERAINANLIDQAGTPLCGPAAFMHCIALTRPDDYIRYVLDLAERGRGNMGDLIVQPSDACLNARLDNKIDPVDWVALASLRDHSNKTRHMRGPDSGFAGITLGGALADWFDKTKWFSGGLHNASRYLTSHSLKHLLAINQRASSHICLLIRSAIITTGTAFDLNRNKFGDSGTPKTLTGFPDHWIVLKGPIKIDHKTAPSPGALRRDDIKALMEKQLDFRLWSWGAESSVRARIHNITPAQFLPYYYGYVSATPY